MSNRIIKIIRQTNNAFPTAIALLYCVIILLLYGLSDTIFYVYSDADLLNVLFANPSFVQSISPEMQTIYFPWQNLNCVIWLCVRLFQLISFKPLIFAAQVALMVIFIFRLMHFLKSHLSYQESHLYYILFFSHPLVWISMITIPSSILTLWLFLECLLCLRNKTNLIWLYISLLLLSFSGLLGFLSAILILAIRSIFHIKNNKGEINQLLISVFAIFPAVIFYGLISLHSQFLGGPFIPQFFSPAAYISLANWINRSWTTNFQSLLYFIGNGFLNLSFLFPAFGILSILGLTSIFEKKSYHEVSLILILFLLGLLICFPFFPLELIQHQLVLLYAVLLWFAVIGFKNLLLQFNVYQKELTLILLILLSLLNLIQFPNQWKNVLQRAMYYESIQFTYHEFIEANPHLAKQSFPMRFSPAIFSNLLSHRLLEPYGLNIVPNQSDNILPNLSLTLPQSNLPKIIFDYAPYNFAQQKGIDSQPDNLQLTSYRDQYSRHRIQNLIIYHLNEENNLIDPPYNRITQEKIGQQWYFDEDFSFTQQTGIAFGTQPSYLQTAVSYASAGPSNLSAEQTLGELASLPFVIEGDEMQIVANMPNNTTQSILCLAVYEEVPYGEQAQIKEARHIYEYQPQQPLMDDIFYYIHTKNLDYSANKLKGWRVVRFENSGAFDWQYINWSLDPWKNKQAIWFAADRDESGAYWIDQITQHERPPGFYWNFETGNYKGWQISGTAMGSKPAQGTFGNQSKIYGEEGNFFINSFYKGSDIPVGKLKTPSLPLTLNRLSFLIGGGNDDEAVYLALVVDGTIVKKAAGQQDEVLRRQVWDLTPWLGKRGHIEIVDQSSGAWGHILVDDIRMFNDD